MVDILAFGAHPDDVEFALGGILAKMAHQGKTIAIVDLTSGEKGTNGDPETRRREGMQAAALIGASRQFLDFADCEIYDTYQGRLGLVKVIRQYKPQLVIAPVWEGVQNHPDHLALGMMARHACRYARFAKILPDLPTHWVKGILHYPSPASEAIDILVDISEYVDIWTQMMRCHSSQMPTFDYADRCLRVASKWGVLMGKPYAQGLVKSCPLVVDDIMDVASSTREL